MTESKNPIGPAGRQVAENVTFVRKARMLSQRALAERLKEVGHPIPATGITRLEKGQRRVDADDLVALAMVLDVKPAALLVPLTISTTFTVTALTEDDQR